MPATDVDLSGAGSGAVGVTACGARRAVGVSTRRADCSPSRHDVSGSSRISRPLGSSGCSAPSPVPRMNRGMRPPHGGNRGAMKPLLSIPVIAALAVLVHLDWHVARPTHHRLSLGLAAALDAVPRRVCCAAGWYLARRFPRAPWLAASLNGGDRARSSARSSSPSSKRCSTTGASPSTSSPSAGSRSASAWPPPVSRWPPLSLSPAAIAKPRTVPNP